MLKEWRDRRDQSAIAPAKTGAVEPTPPAVQEFPEPRTANELSGVQPVDATAPKSDTPDEPGLVERLLTDESGAFDPQALKENLAEKTHGAEDKFLDKLGPLRRLVNEKGVGAEKDPYLAARRYAGHFGKVIERLDDLSEKLTPARGLEKQTKEYAQLERYEELAGRGIDKFPGGETIDQIRARKAALEQELGPEKLAQVHSALHGIREWSDGLLQEARDAGVISPESYDADQGEEREVHPVAAAGVRRRQARSVAARRELVQCRESGFRSFHQGQREGGNRSLRRSRPERLQSRQFDRAEQGRAERGRSGGAPGVQRHDHKDSSLSRTAAGHGEVLCPDRRAEARLPCP
jgi:hypothetical protein